MCAVHAELLGAIADHIPPPPDAVLAHFDLDAMLDGHTSTAGNDIPPPAADPMQEAAGHLEGPEPMQVDPGAAHPFRLDEAALQQAVQDDPDSRVHSQLYHLLAQCQPDMFDDMGEDVILRQEGHEQIQETLLITRYDLCYNPRRYESWERVVSKLSHLTSLLWQCETTLPACTYSTLVMLLEHHKSQQAHRLCHLNLEQAFLSLCMRLYCITKAMVVSCHGLISSAQHCLVHIHMASAKTVWLSP